MSLPRIEFSFGLAHYWIRTAYDGPAIVFRVLHQDFVGVNIEHESISARLHVKKIEPDRLASVPVRVLAGIEERIELLAVGVLWMVRKRFVVVPSDPILTSLLAGLRALLDYMSRLRAGNPEVAAGDPADCR